jgi:hypothetical protein
VNTAMNLRVPQNVRIFLSGCITGGFSRRAQLHGVSQSVGYRFISPSILHDTQIVHAFSSV